MGSLSQTGIQTQRESPEKKNAIPTAQTQSSSWRHRRYPIWSPTECQDNFPKKIASPESCSSGWLAVISIPRALRGPCGCLGRAVNHQEVKNGNSVHISFVSLGQTCRGCHLGRVSWCNTIPHNYIRTVISPKKMGSRDRLPVLA